MLKCSNENVSLLCIQHISQLALFYVDALYKSLLVDSTIMYDENGRFKFSERVEIESYWCSILRAWDFRIGSETYDCVYSSNR